MTNGVRKLHLIHILIVVSLHREREIDAHKVHLAHKERAFYSFWSDIKSPEVFKFASKPTHGLLSRLVKVSGQHEFSLAVTLHLFAKRIYLRNKLVAKSFKLRPGVLFSWYAVKFRKA